MKGIPLHPLRLAAPDRMKVLRVPMTNLGNVKLVERATPADWNAGRAHPNMRRFEDWKDKDSGALFFIETGSVVFVPAPYSPGDYFVKEAWGIEPGRYVQPLAEYPIGGRFDDEVFYRIDDPNLPGIAWRSPMHMLEKYARYIVTLGPPVPCRLGEVTEEMAMQEGIQEEWRDVDGRIIYGSCGQLGFGHKDQAMSARGAYEKMWAKMYPKHTDPGTWTWGYPMEVRKKA